MQQITREILSVNYLAKNGPNITVNHKSEKNAPCFIAC
jgi:hypothetical protein